jgi:aspartate-semialdehyde dehydrogenase
MNSSSDVKIPVKKGDRLLVEVEFQKDMDLYEDASILIQSLYGKECIINDEFKVVRIVPKRNENDIKNLVISRLENLIEDIELM